MQATPHCVWACHDSVNHWGKAQNMPWLQNVAPWEFQLFVKKRKSKLPALTGMKTGIAHVMFKYKMRNHLIE